MPLPWEDYSPIIAEDMEGGKICGCDVPVITSIYGPDSNNPLRIAAGMGEILTIKGSNFGNFSAQTSKVFFKNGDDGGDTWMQASPTDFYWDGILHWTNDEIRIKVPSTDINPNDGGVNKPAASGPVRVENPCDDVVSTENLDIPYAVFNLKTSTGPPKKIGLKELNDGGICFSFNQDLPGWIREEFRNALSAWCPHTNVVFFINDGTVPTSASNATDGINLVIGESLSTEGAGAA